MITPRDDSPALRLMDVARVYECKSEKVHALGPVSHDIFAGEFVAIMGPSGSGKSTLLALAGALDRPTSGRVLLENRDLAAMSPHELALQRRRTIGYVFQNLNLVPGLTALENVALPLELDGQRMRAAREAAAVALEETGMGRFANRFPDDLSGGEQQRVAIARAVVGPRSLLLADEPTGSLDTATGEAVMRLLRVQCDHGRTVVLVTHNSSHAAWADRVLYLRDGRIVDEVRSESAPHHATLAPRKAENR